jgi:hypothetical protein
MFVIRGTASVNARIASRELDVMFERLAVKLLKEKYGEPRFPFDTEDLKTFIEQHVEDLDQYADLTNTGQASKG